MWLDTVAERLDRQHEPRMELHPLHSLCARAELVRIRRVDREADRERVQQAVPVEQRHVVGDDPGNVVSQRGKCEPALASAPRQQHGHGSLSTGETERVQPRATDPVEVGSHARQQQVPDRFAHQIAVNALNNRALRLEKHQRAPKIVDDRSSCVVVHNVARRNERRLERPEPRQVRRRLIDPDLELRRRALSSFEPRPVLAHQLLHLGPRTPDPDAEPVDVKAGVPRGAARHRQNLISTSTLRSRPVRR